MAKGKNLTPKQIEKIISKGKSDEIKGFISRKNPDKTFSAIVVLKNKNTGDLGFEFPPKKEA